jgi:hypothetical protein
MRKIITHLGCLLLISSLCTMSITPAMAQTHPDLQPTSIQVANLYAGASNKITVVVANNEDVAVADFDVKLEVDDGEGYTEIDTITGNSILGNDDAWYWPVSVMFDWAPADAGDYTLRAIVDSDGAVEEVEEGNNQLEQMVTVIAADPITVNVRVEGQEETIWSGEVTFFSSTITDKYGDTYTIEVPTAMGAIHAASISGEFDLVIDSMFRPVDYVEEVAGEGPVLEPPYPGWMFRVNWATTDIGAVDYGLADGDTVLWSYTVWGVEPLRTTVSTNSVLSGDTFDVTVEAYDGASWNAVPADVPVYVGTLTYATDDNGQVLGLDLNPGGYTVYADQGDYVVNIRSNKETVIVYVPLNLDAGWNFISVPKRLASGYSTAQQLFGSVDTAGHSIFLNDPVNGWTAMDTGTVVLPLDGIWIYSAAAVELHPAFDTNPRQVPPTKQLAAGWNAIGFSDFTEASANSALTSVEDKWSILIGFDAATQTYEVSIINNAPAGDPHDEDRDMSCWKGYWLHMTSAGDLAGIGS